MAVNIVEIIPDGEHTVSICPLEHAGSAVQTVGETAVLSLVRKDQMHIAV